MIRFSVNIMRVRRLHPCSITEHEGRIIQNRSHESILHEIEEMRDKVPGFTGVVSDLAARLRTCIASRARATISKSTPQALVRVPGICENLNTDHSSLIELYRKARPARGEEDPDCPACATTWPESPEYVKELVTHHVGGPEIAPEHTERGRWTR